MIFLRSISLALVACAVLTLPAAAQTSYNNTNAGPVMADANAIAQSQRLVQQGDTRRGLSSIDPASRRVTPAEKAAMLDNGREMLRDIKRQLKQAGSDEERQSLLQKKHDVEVAMVEVQQM